MSSKQAELVALEEKKALLEKELEEWKEKVEEGTGDTSPLSYKPLLLALYNESCCTFSSKMVLRVHCFLRYLRYFYAEHPFFEKNTLFKVNFELNCQGS